MNVLGVSDNFCLVYPRSLASSNREGSEDHDHLILYRNYKIYTLKPLFPKNLLFQGLLIICSRKNLISLILQTINLTFEQIKIMLYQYLIGKKRKSSSAHKLFLSEF